LEDLSEEERKINMRCRTGAAVGKSRKQAKRHKGKIRDCGRQWGGEKMRTNTRSAKGFHNRTCQGVKIEFAS